MTFADRVEAGKKLADALKQYKGGETVVYALPRGGVVLGIEVAKELGALLDLLIPRKIGHPSNEEYAIAAVTETGDAAKNEDEVRNVDPAWFVRVIEEQRTEAKRRREKYLAGRPTVAVENKTAIIVDDGMATGLTLKAAILELKLRHPKKIVIAVPVAPKDTVDDIKKTVDEVVALDAPEFFLGSIGAYYKVFAQVSDEEVVEMMGKQALLK